MPRATSWSCVPELCSVSLPYSFVAECLCVTFSAIHHEYQPHKWAISWTTERTHDEGLGGAFYLSQYATRVVNAANTLITFMPVDFHGTSLPPYGPHETKPTFVQRGLAIATPNRLPRTWSAYQAGLMSKTEAIDTIYSNDDIMY